MLFSEATTALGEFAEQTGIPVAETQAGKGSLAVTIIRNRWARWALPVPWRRTDWRATPISFIGIGTRYSDFTTASMTAFQNPDVRFINLNTAEFDAYKVGAIPLVADAREALEELSAALARAIT